MYRTYTFSQHEIEEVKLALDDIKESKFSYRLQSVYMKMQGLKIVQIAKLLNKDRIVIGQWIKKYKTEGLESLLKENRGGARNNYLTSEQEDFIKDVIANSSPSDCGYESVVWSGEIIVDLIEKMYNKKYTPEGVYALLKRLNITYKKANKVDPKKSQKKINEWKNEIKKN